MACHCHGHHHHEHNQDENRSWFYKNLGPIIISGVFIGIGAYQIFYNSDKKVETKSEKTIELKLENINTNK